MGTTEQPQLVNAGFQPSTYTIWDQIVFGLLFPCASKSRKSKDSVVPLGGGGRNFDAWNIDGRMMIAKQLKQIQGKQVC